MADAFYIASFGGIRLWASEVRTSNNRRLIVHSPTAGNVHPTTDHGLDSRPATCTLLFDDMEGETASPRERFNALCALIEGGEPQMFTHPLRGSYLACVRMFDHTAGEGALISAQVELVPEGEVPPVEVANAGTSAVAGEGAVSAATEAADAELEAFGLSTPVTGEALTAVSQWQESESPPARAVAVDVARISASIGTEIERLGLDRNIKLWPAHAALVLVGDALLAAGRAATSDVARLMTVRVGRRIALRTLLASIYGGREVENRVPQVMGLNDIATPGWLEPDSELRLPQPAVQLRVG
ncbi:MAG: hypothetical protein AB7O24_04245 [Kofleriaceae bacterium]